MDFLPDFPENDVVLETPRSALGPRPSLCFHNFWLDFWLKLVSMFTTIRATIIAILLLLIRLNATKDILRLGVAQLVSQSEKGGLNLSGYLPAMQLAFESITNDTTLPFDFNVTVNDSMVGS